MSIVWKITGVECQPQLEGKVDVVVSIGFAASKTVDDGYFTAVESRTVGVQYVANDPFTPFSELTEAQMLEWVQTALGEIEIDEIGQRLDQQIQARTPVTVSKPLPWVQE